jgi:D-sedoheptulose 7-phosphate isomerase
MSDQEAARRMALGAIADAQNAAQKLIEDSFADLWRGFEMIRDTFAAGHHVHVCGNGGSAADAQHFVTELVVRLDASSRRRPLAATALSTDTSILTAAANDYGFDHVFSRQIEARARKDDLLVLISTSGNSPNLLKAAEVAGAMGVHTVALLGKSGGVLRNQVDCPVVIPSDNTQRIQEVHALCIHLWCEWLDPVFTD